MIAASKEINDELVRNLVSFHRDFQVFRRATRAKKLVGPTFGAGDYEIASYANHPDGGLHEIWYFVVHAASGIPVCSGLTKGEATATASALLSNGGTALSSAIVSAHLVIQKQAEESAARARAAAAAAINAAKKSSALKPIPKRRQDVFDASGGSCHYCGTKLEIRGKWHIEHKMPRALMGGSEPSNLVASCVSCNMKKRDKTDVEFIAQTQRGEK